MEPLTLNELMYEFRLASGVQHDPWGACLGTLFDVCEWLTLKGHYVPDSWGYFPGALGVPEEGSYLFDVFDSADPEAVLELGHRLDRACAAMRAKQMDY